MKKKGGLHKKSRGYMWGKAHKSALDGKHAAAKKKGKRNLKKAATH